MRTILQEAVVEAGGRKEAPIPCASGYYYGSLADASESRAFDFTEGVGGTRKPTLERYREEKIEMRRILGYGENIRIGKRLGRPNFLPKMLFVVSN
jgi:hypothetical protein